MPKSEPKFITIGTETLRVPAYGVFTTLCQNGYITFVTHMTHCNPSVVLHREHMDTLWALTLNDLFPTWTGGSQTRSKKQKKLDDALAQCTSAKVERFWVTRSLETGPIPAPSDGMNSKSIQDVSDSVQQRNREEADDDDEDEDEDEQMDVVDDDPFCEDGREVFEPYGEGIRRKPLVAHGSFRLPGTRQMQLNSAMRDVTLDTAQLEGDADTMDMS